MSERFSSAAYIYYVDYLIVLREVRRIMKEDKISDRFTSLIIAQLMLGDSK